jgi:hypothetical protein
MDQEAVAKLRQAGIDTSMEDPFPAIPVRLDEDTGKPASLDVEVPVQSGKQMAIVPLKAIPELFAGTARPPSFARGPTEEYVLFFALIERTAVDYCAVTGRAEYDEEFERLYRQLRRRPDGRDSNPLFSYLQAATRLYMSLRDVSRDEFDAVAQRLSQSARHFASGPTSTTYYDTVREHVR